MQEIMEKQPIRKVKGITVTIMTDKGLYQRFFEGLKEPDLIWLQVSECYDPQGAKGIHSHEFSSTKLKKGGNKQ